MFESKRVNMMQIDFANHEMVRSIGVTKEIGIYRINPHPEWKNEHCNAYGSFSRLETAQTFVRAEKGPWAPA